MIIAYISIRGDKRMKTKKVVVTADDTSHLPLTLFGEIVMERRLPGAAVE